MKKNFQQPQKVKTLNRHEQDLFLGHTNAPAADSNSSCTGASSTDELDTAGLHAGQATTNKATGQSHRVKCHTRPGPPDSTAGWLCA